MNTHETRGTRRLQRGKVHVAVLVALGLSSCSEDISFDGKAATSAGTLDAGDGGGDALPSGSQATAATATSATATSATATSAIAASAIATSASTPVATQVPASTAEASARPPASSASTVLGPVDSGVPDPPSASQFHIDLRFVAEVKEPVRAAFLAAQARWERALIGDLPDVEVMATGDCGGAQLSGKIDDVVIFVDVAEIDGKGNILGSASPCAVRQRAPSLPLAGLMRFDEADLSDFAQNGRLEEVVLHEMAHVLGFGSLWKSHKLLVNASSGNDAQRDTSFLGPLAIAAFDAVGAGAYGGAKVPVENIGGEGTANGHWRESQLGDELMTSFLSEHRGPLSAITIASFADLGYQVNPSEADAYAWSSTQFKLRASEFQTAQVREAELLIPIRVFDAEGMERGTLLPAGF